MSDTLSAVKQYNANLPVKKRPATMRRRSSFAAPSGWETVAKVIAREKRQAQRAKLIAYKGGIQHIAAFKYWIDYTAALSKIRTLLKSEMKPSPNEKGQR